MALLQMGELSLTGKRLLIRADLNVPINNGQITSDARIRAVLPTIQLALQQGAKVVVASHLGRPTEGSYTDEFSLAPIVNHLKQQLECPVRLVKEYLHGLEVAAGEVVVLENVRFNLGESGNHRLLAAQYATLCDIFVMEAFGAAHRAHASTHGVAHFAPIACAGPLLMNELTSISKALHNPTRPLVVIVSGSKISSKLPLLQRLSEIADQVIVGGGIANTFIAAQGHSVGKSLYEAALIPQVRQLMDATTIPVVTDVRVAKSFSEHASAVLKSVTDVQPDEYILDIGDETAQRCANILSSAKTILWNGPLGAFEWQNFRHGTAVIAQAIADSSAFSIAGGGDTIAAIELFGIANRIDYISTGGCAFLELVEGKKLPAIAMLEARAGGQAPDVV